MAPHDFSVRESVEQINQKFDEFASEHHLRSKNRDLMTYANFELNHKKGTDFTVYPADERSVTPKTVFMVFDAASYDLWQASTSDLTGKSSHPLAHNEALKGQKQFTINGHDQVKKKWARILSPIMFQISLI